MTKWNDVSNLPGLSSDALDYIFKLRYVYGIRPPVSHEHLLTTLSLSWNEDASSFVAYWNGYDCTLSLLCGKGMAVLGGMSAAKMPQATLQGTFFTDKEGMKLITDTVYCLVGC